MTSRIAPSDNMPGIFMKSQYNRPLSWLFPCTFIQGYILNSVSFFLRLQTRPSRVRFPTVVEIFLFSKMSTPPLEATYPPIDGCWGIFRRSESGRGVKLTTQLVPMFGLR